MIDAAPKVVAAAITARRDWAPHLFSFRLQRPDGIAFVPGQFVRLGIEGADGAMVWRAYSIASPPSATWLEFYSIVVPDGPFSQPLSRRRVGDTVHVDRTVYGFLRTDRFEGGRHLWLIASGTGIAPFIAMLGDAAIWSRFDEIVVVHTVQREAELAYRDELAGFAQTSTARARCRYLPIVTRERIDGVSHQRVTRQLDDGTLEATTGLSIDADDARLMICGNPSMIKEVRASLGKRGLTPVRREVPGHFIVENIW